MVRVPRTDGATLCIAPIVEGHGEEKGALRETVSRIGYELLGGKYLEILRPIRHPKSQLTDIDGLSRALSLARLKLQAKNPAARSLVLVLIDADADLPCELGPSVEDMAARHHSDLDVACVVANVEFETWFVAASESLVSYLNLEENPPVDPETEGLGKGWIKQRFRGPSYSETIDQPKLASRMDLQLCRQRSPSFDKLCREIEKRLPDAKGAASEQ